MKDGKYEVGDVIAFRVTKKGRIAGKPWIGMEHIFLEADGTSDDGFALERIPNPKLMEGEWWKGWTWKKWNGKDELPSGAMILVGGNTDNYKCWNNGGEIVSAEEGIRVERPVLIPPKSSPCPELKAKIEKLEAELAELKKQALGE